MIIPSATHRWQFNVRSLLTITAIVAVMLTFIPLACGLPFELLFVFAIPLVAAAAYSDAVAAQSRRIPRLLISFALGVVTIGLIYQLFTRAPHVIVPWLTWPWSSIVVSTSLAMLRCPLPVAKRRFYLSSLALIIIAATTAWQYYDTADDRHFVQRHILQSRAPLISQDGALYVKGGDIHFSLAPYLRDLPSDDLSQFRALYKAADRPSLYAPITQLRLFTSVAYMETLYLSDSTTDRDWECLSHQAQLSHLSFTRLKITPNQVQSFETLKNVHQLAFFNCELPPNVAGATQKSNLLYIFQVFDCRNQGFAGLSKNGTLRTLVLRNTTLTHNDLAEIARLPLLTDVHLRGTGLANEQLLHFANCLSSALGSRQGRFLLTIDANTIHLESLRALIQSGAISELKLANCKLSETELKTLSAVDPKIPVTPVLGP